MGSQPGPPVATVARSGSRRLERSSWKAEAIRRGQLKISGPFPLEEETSGPDVTRRHTDPFPSPIEEPPTQSDNQNQQNVSPNTDLDSNKATNVDELQNSQLPDAEDTATGMPDLEEKKHAPASVHLDTPKSSPSPFISDTEMQHPRKKRRSGLRNVLRRMFSRKSKPDKSVAATSPASKHVHQHSVSHCHAASARSSTKLNVSL
jgi:hypothetical protein